jgi:hypothetical protein
MGSGGEVGDVVELHHSCPSGFTLSDGQNLNATAGLLKT